MLRLTLKEARKRDKRNWNPDQLAEAAGVNRATVYRIEAGDITNPSNDTVERLELALKLKRGTLLFGPARIEAKAS